MGTTAVTKREENTVFQESYRKVESTHTLTNSQVLRSCSQERSFQKQDRNVQKITKSINSTIMRASSIQDLASLNVDYEPINSPVKVHADQTKFSFKNHVVAGPGVTNQCPSTRQTKPKKLQWSFIARDLFSEAVEIWPTAERKSSAKQAFFNVRNPKPTLKPRDALEFALSHQHFISKEKVMNLKRHNQVIIVQLPRKELVLTTEKDDWLNSYKNCLEIKLERPKRKKSRIPFNAEKRF